MSMSVLLFVILFKIHVTLATDTKNVPLDRFYEYCSLSCKDYFTGAIHTHTVCARGRQSCAPSYLCTDYQTPSMTNEVRQVILDKHNELRNKIAIGDEYSQPPAANMNALNWDMELEFIAQCLANTCDFKHDKCRRTSKFEVGQNLAIFMSTDPSLLTLETTADRVQAWYNEVKDMQVQFVNEFPSHYSGPVIGHYTQMVWAEAEFVGCGRSIYKQGSMYTMFLVCNYGGYGTPGNLLDGQIYEKGEACSKCRDKGCNSQYTALCGDVKPIVDYDHRGWDLGTSAVSTNKYLVMFPLLFWGIVIRIYI